MESKTITIIIAISLISAVLGFGAGYVFYTPTIADLSNEYNSLNNEHESLQSEKSLLESVYTQLVDSYAYKTKLYEDLTEDYSGLTEDYDTLEDDYNTLQIRYNSKEDQYNQADSNLKILSQNVLNLYDELNSYVVLEDAIPRVVNYDEVLKISDKTNSVTGRDKDRWDGYYKIHKYVRDEIKYTHDAEIPVLTSITSTGPSYATVVTSFKSETVQNMIQTLEYTVEYEQGDCDDQAILEYCMIQYYREYIVEENYELYLARISFNEGNSHLAVFMPVTEGRICILDPAGQYQTGSWTYITGEDTERELEDYNDHWDEQKGIKTIKLFSVDIDNGNFEVTFEGTLYETIDFLS